MILVVGGSGTLGAPLVRLLRSRAVPFRVLSRHRPTELAPEEHVAGDVRDAGAVAGAMAGVSVVISAMHGFASDPRGIDHRGNLHLIEAACALGVKQFVLVSVHGAAVDHPIALFRMKHLAEVRLRATSLAWTIVRPTAFMETWLGLVGRPLLASGKTTLFGRGTNPINFVSAHDVATVVVEAALDPTSRDRVIEVGGPENLSFREFMSVFARETGAAGKTSHVPLGVMRVAALLTGVFRPSVGRQIRAGVAMDTREDMAFVPDGDSQARTTLSEAIRRDFATPARDVLEGRVNPTT